jgi:hypothetical protein
LGYESRCQQQQQQQQAAAAATTAGCKAIRTLPIFIGFGIFYFASLFLG